MIDFLADSNAPARRRVRNFTNAKEVKIPWWAKVEQKSTTLLAQDVSLR
jgi:hypothetical protein